MSQPSPFYAGSTKCIQASQFIHACPGKRWRYGAGSRLEEAIRDALGSRQGPVVIDFTGVAGAALIDFFMGMVSLQDSLPPETLRRCLVDGLAEPDLALLHRALAIAGNLLAQVKAS